MSIVFLLSVILKGLGAVLEVLLQVMITRMLGLAGYGTYSTWVSAADLVYWVLFSGITKCNTFYLSNKGTELRRFKAKYYSCYVLPVLTTLALVLALEKGRGGYTVIALITGMELLVMDHSSTMMAQGQPGCALFGEYVLGRSALRRRTGRNSCAVRRPRFRSRRSLAAVLVYSVPRFRQRLLFQHRALRSQQYRSCCRRSHTPAFRWHRQSEADRYRQGIGSW